ncbi:Uu.00g101760.m01.CDS01 [Anthostomella pinea]|uniref:Uu.00g101760.m01.CDS01 n=1 Tax=Anthostomella pinea TaxID=933095 RepID=A0AAI8VE82_9PEZI|nr:Uu.00g101760.m01.CDS01 [Anthostomella pinea]
MSLARLRNLKTQSWPPRPTFTEANVPAGSQAGRVFMVTGGNAGIGFELCKILYPTGATIYMASRSRGKAETAIKAITESVPRTQAGRGHIKFLHLDLNDLDSVKAAAHSFAQQESKLDVLWNNAGAGANRVKLGERTAQGFEPMMGMHCVATLLFSALLTPQLKAAAAGAESTSGATRIVWLASALVDSGSKHGIDFGVLETGTSDSVQNYAASKMGSWILGREFARRHGRDGILSVALNPGNLRTGGYDGTSKLLMSVLNATMLHEPVIGAYSELFAGLSPEITMEQNGIYIIPWGRLLPDADVVRQDILSAMKPEEEGGLGYGRRFWEWCETQWKPYV